MHGNRAATRGTDEGWRGEGRGVTGFAGLAGPARRGNALVGCLVVLGVLLVVAVVGVVVVMLNWRSWTASGLVSVSQALITELDKEGSLPVGEGTDMQAHVVRFADAFKSKQIGPEEFATFMQSLVTSDLFPVGTLYALELGYLPKSALTAEEQAAGAVTLQRLAAALHEGVLSSDDINGVMGTLQTVDAESGQQSLKPAAEVTAEELRGMISAGDAKLAEVGFRADPGPRIDISDELGRQVDAAINGTASGAGPLAAPTTEGPADGSTEPATVPEGATSGG